LSVASRVPLGLNAIDVVSVPSVGNGEPATCVSAPHAPTENIVTLSVVVTPAGLSAGEATASSAPFGLNAIDSGTDPTLNGDPATWVSEPFAATENTDTLVVLELWIASSDPFGLNATDAGDDPTKNGDPATSVSAPLAATENIETLPSR
jgi:hypothetical protein